MMAKDLTDFSIAAILELSDEDIPSFKDTHLLDDQERLQRTLTEFAKERQIEDCGSPDKKKKTRTVFTRQQIQRLENAFDRKKYFTNSERQKLASELCLSETQVKIWLQNRRNKWKKQICTDGHHSNIPYHSLIPDISRDVAPTDRHYPLLNRRDFRGYDERPKLFS